MRSFDYGGCGPMSEIGPYEVRSKFYKLSYLRNWPLYMGEMARAIIDIITAPFGSYMGVI